MYLSILRCQHLCYPCYLTHLEVVFHTVIPWKASRGKQSMEGCRRDTFALYISPTNWLQLYTPSVSLTLWFFHNVTLSNNMSFFRIVWSFCAYKFEESFKFWNEVLPLNIFCWFDIKVFLKFEEFQISYWLDNKAFKCFFANAIYFLISLNV